MSIPTNKALYEEVKKGNLCKVPEALSLPFWFARSGVQTKRRNLRRKGKTDRRVEPLVPRKMVKPTRRSRA